MKDSRKPDEARDIMDAAVVWDNVWPLEPMCGNDYDKLDIFAQEGFTVLSITVAGDNHGIGEAVRRIASARTRILADPGRYLLVESIADVIRAKNERRLGIALHLEGTRCFERSLEMIEAFYKLGIRHTLLAFNQSNSIGGGCAERNDGGLTVLGAQFVRQMQRVGMLVDLSHTGRRTSLNALELATKPMVFTHSNSDALHKHFRNITDEQALACARTGGVVGVSGSSQYLGDATASSASIFRHIDYYAEKLGVGHVALGLDLVFDARPLDDWMRSRPEEWPMVVEPGWPGVKYASAAQLCEVVGLMLDHGYPEDSVRAILGGNYLRICREVWR